MDMGVSTVYLKSKEQIMWLKRTLVGEQKIWPEHLKDPGEGGF